MIYDPQLCAIEDKAMLPFISQSEIDNILSEAKPDAVTVRKIIAKSLQKKRLSMQETAMLVNVTDPLLVEEISLKEGQL